MPVLEAQTWIARRGEAEYRLVPVMNRQDAFCSNCSHRSLEIERQLRLIGCRWTEQGYVKFVTRARRIEAALAPCQLESGAQQLRVGARAGHAQAEFGVVVLAAARLIDERHHM